MFGGTDPIPPRENRHGIPNLGGCVRCNLQLEGEETKGNGGPNGVGSKRRGGR